MRPGCVSAWVVSERPAGWAVGLRGGRGRRVSGVAWALEAAAAARRTGGGARKCTETNEIALGTSEEQQLEMDVMRGRGRNEAELLLLMLLHSGEGEVRGFEEGGNP